MICASAQVESTKYRKVQGNGRSTWLVPVDNDPHKIHVDTHDPNSDGYGGRIISFDLEDGSEYKVKGPWNSNTDALYADTGIDLRSAYNIKIRIYDQDKLFKAHDRKGNQCRQVIEACAHGFLEEVEYKNCGYNVDREEAPKFIKKYGKDLRISVFVYHPYTGNFEPSSSGSHSFK